MRALRILTIATVATILPGCARRGVVDLTPVQPQPMSYEGAIQEANIAPESEFHSSVHQHTFDPAVSDSDVAVDPTGHWLAVSRQVQGRPAKIYLQRISDGSTAPLTGEFSPDADESMPVFSPDGGQIAFASNHGGTWHIYVTDWDGRSVTQLTRGGSDDLHASFSPDGTRLAYTSHSGDNDKWEIWVSDLQTGERTYVGEGLSPSWSPSRSVDRIAFQHPSSPGSVFTVDLVDGRAEHGREIQISTRAAVTQPSWNPDGSRLAVSTIVEPIMDDVGKPVGHQDVWTVAPDGSDRRRLTDGKGSSQSPCWSPDGRIFFVSDRGGWAAVWSTSDAGNASNGGFATTE